MHCLQISGLEFEHVEPIAKPGPGMQSPTALGHPGQNLGSLKIGIGECGALEKAHQQDAQIRAVIDYGRTHPGLLRGPGVDVLVIAVDTQQVPASGTAPGDVGPGRGGDLHIAVGQATRQILDPAWLSGQYRELVEQCIQVRVGNRWHRPTLPARARADVGQFTAVT